MHGREVPVLSCDGLVGAGGVTVLVQLLSTPLRLVGRRFRGLVDPMPSTVVFTRGWPNPLSATPLVHVYQ